MRMPTRTPTLTLLASLVLPASASAQDVVADLHRDVNGVQQKIVALAKAIPATAYDWRPPGARSVGETLLHVAGDNYLIPSTMGKPVPASVAIDAADPKSVGAYETRKQSKERIVAEVEASFTHLHEAMDLTTDANRSQTISFFGQPMTRQLALIFTATHLHEHLGQLIAYARSNNVVPPWSR